MGCSTEIRISKDARVDDVAKVIGILSGLSVKWDGTADKKARWIKVLGASVEGIVNIPSCANIDIDAPAGEELVDGYCRHCAMFHFQPSSTPLTHNLMIPPSTAFWIAVGLKLCKFFGGAVKYNDCESLKFERYFKRPRKDNAPSDGKPWNDFQKDMDRAHKVAAYK